MRIHEVPRGKGVTLCCGTFPLLLPSGDLVTEQAEIVTCDSRAPRCPDCKVEADYIDMRTEPSEFIPGESTVTLKVDPCAHEFWVWVGIQDPTIRLERREV